MPYMNEEERVRRAIYGETEHLATPTVYDFWHNIPAPLIMRLMRDNEWAKSVLTVRGYANFLVFVRRYIKAKERGET